MVNVYQAMCMKGLIDSQYRGNRNVRIATPVNCTQAVLIAVG